MTAAPRVLLFDLYHTGHHGQYVRVLMEHWVARRSPGRLDIVVSHEFARRYPELVASAAGAPDVAVHPTTAPMGLREKTGRRAVLANDLQIGRVLRQAVEQHAPDHVILPYADHVQFSLATGLRFRRPVRISGIYFRPSFYYHAAGRGPRTRRTLADDLQKRVLLWLALRNPHVDTLFTLDPYAVGPVRRLGARVVALPEAVETDVVAGETPLETRARLGIGPGRRMLLLFGSLDPRKGVRELLEALGSLPDDTVREAALVMAGESVAVQREVAAAVETLQARGALQIVHLDAFVPDAEMHRLFAAADLVLLPYQRHVGSSGVLVRAAAAGVPVLGQDYGMMGALLDEHRLGLAVDTTSPAAIARGLARFLDPAVPYPFDASAARAFAAANTEHAMASTLWTEVLRPMP